MRSINRKIFLCAMVLVTAIVFMSCKQPTSKNPPEPKEEYEYPSELIGKWSLNPPSQFISINGAKTISLEFQASGKVIHTYTYAADTSDSSKFMTETLYWYVKVDDGRLGIKEEKNSEISLEYGDYSVSGNTLNYKGKQFTKESS